ncbi:MAG: hypothetical protein IJ795_02770 [Bacteroidales bacterium]|nr:hypothetical protein [Bacteroidales bacterium]
MPELLEDERELPEEAVEEEPLLRRETCEEVVPDLPEEADEELRRVVCAPISAERASIAAIARAASEVLAKVLISDEF